MRRSAAFCSDLEALPQTSSCLFVGASLDVTPVELPTGRLEYVESTSKSDSGVRRGTKERKERITLTSKVKIQDWINE